MSLCIRFKLHIKSHHTAWARKSQWVKKHEASVFIKWKTVQSQKPLWVNNKPQVNLTKHFGNNLLIFVQILLKKGCIIDI